MNKIKKLYTLVLLIITVIFLFSCTETQSSGPKIYLNDNTITWNVDSEAVKYNIFANNKLIDQVTTNSYVLNLSVGSYKIKISIVYKDAISPYSNEVEYVVEDKEVVLPDEKPQSLDTPVITLSGTKVSWTSVKYATLYKVYVNDVLVKTQKELYYQIESTKVSNIYVIAHNEEYNIDSPKSNVVSFTPGITKGDKVNIFSINDTHGAIVDDSSNVSMARVSSLIKELEQNEKFIKVANGDMFQGTYVSNITQGNAMIDVLNAMNFDLMVIGNHEFDWGIETIGKYKDGNLENGEANFPILAANIIDNKTSSTLPWTDDYVIINNNGYKVGIIGVIGEALTSSISSDKIEGYTFTNSVTVVERLAKELRLNQKCDSVIVATHDYDTATNASYAALYGDARIDGILCAHTHQLIKDRLTRSDSKVIYALQSNTKNGTAGTMTLSFVDDKYSSTTINHYYPNSYDIDLDIQKVISKYQDIIDEGDRVIGYNTDYMSKEKVGIMAMNAAASYLKVDVACVNSSGIRGTLNSGDVLVKDIFNVFPFDNAIYIVELKGSLLNQVCTFSGLYFNSGTKNFQNNQTYKLGIIDFLYTKEYYQNLFKDCKSYSSEVYLRDVVLWHYENNA